MKPGNVEREHLQALGLARRAGRAVIGTQAVLAAARAGEISLLIVAKDATANAVHRVRHVVEEVPVMRIATTVGLGEALGRGRVAVVGITDVNLASQFGHVAKTASGRNDSKEEV